jgi:hypothetical protein
MPDSSEASGRHQWHVARSGESELEETLNRLDGDWEIFSVTPTIHFGKKVMGAPVPSEILYTIIVRRSIHG